MNNRAKAYSLHDYYTNNSKGVQHIAGTKREQPQYIVVKGRKPYEITRNQSK